MIESQRDFPRIRDGPEIATIRPSLFPNALRKGMGLDFIGVETLVNSFRSGSAVVLHSVMIFASRPISAEVKLKSLNHWKLPLNRQAFFNDSSPDDFNDSIQLYPVRIVVARHVRERSQCPPSCKNPQVPGSRIHPMRGQLFTERYAAFSHREDQA